MHGVSESAILREVKKNMNYIKYIMAALIISILAAGIISANDVLRGEYTGPFAEVKENVQINTKLPDVPAQVSVLKVNGKNFDEVQAKKLVEIALDIKAQESKKLPDNKGIALKDNEKVVILYEGGQMKFSSGKELDNKFMKSEMLDDQAAKNKALGHIRKLAELDMLDVSAVDTSKMVVEYDEEYISYDGKIEKFILNQHVNVETSYDGMPLRGPGAKIRTYFGKNGELLGILNGVGKPVADKKVPVISPEKAIELLKERGYRDVTIDSIEFAYDVPPTSENAEFIYPVYLFQGKSHTVYGEDVPFYTSVPAVAK